LLLLGSRRNPLHTPCPPTRHSKASAGHRIPGGEQRHIHKPGQRRAFGYVASHRFPGAVLRGGVSPGYGDRTATLLSLVMLFADGVLSAVIGPWYPTHKISVRHFCLRDARSHFGFDCLGFSRFFWSPPSDGNTHLEQANMLAKTLVLVRRAFNPVLEDNNGRFNPTIELATLHGPITTRSSNDKATDIIGCSERRPDVVQVFNPAALRNRNKTFGLKVAQLQTMTVTSLTIPLVGCASMVTRLCPGMLCLKRPMHAACKSMPISSAANHHDQITLTDV